MNSKQREELQRISEAITVTTLPSGVRLVSNTMSIEDIKQIIDECLAEPLRNCDIGTAEEQYIRWNNHCESMGARCGDCNLGKECFDLTAICFAAWSQMPYEGGK